MRIEPHAPVIVGVNGSAEAREAALLAADEAMARVTPLVVVHVVDVSDTAAAQMAKASRLVSKVAAAALAEHPGLAVSTRLVTGEPVRTLAALSHDGCLVVVGHRLRHPHHRAGGMGNLAAEHLVRHSSSPVIVHRPLATGGAPALPRPVLLGVDGASTGEAVVRFAFAEASLRGAPLLVVTTWSDPADRQPAQIGADGPGTATVREGAEWRTDEVVARWGEKYPEVEVREEVRHGIDTPIVLTAASRSAQLAVVGARGYAVQVLLARAGCPVAVVPPDGHDR